MFEDAVAQVQHAISGVGVLVAGLSDAAGVDDLASAIQRKWLAVPGQGGSGFAIGVVQGINHGLVWVCPTKQ